MPTHFAKVVLTSKPSSPTTPEIPELALGAFVLPNAPIPDETPLENFVVPGRHFDLFFWFFCRQLTMHRQWKWLNTLLDFLSSPSQSSRLPNISAERQRVKLLCVDLTMHRKGRPCEGRSQPLDKKSMFTGNDNLTRLYICDMLAF